jgi:two-component system chemotaxis response regulator CheB
VATAEDLQIIALGASAGGVEALTKAVRRLPADLPAAVFVVLHISPVGLSVLPSILERAGNLPAAHAVDGAPIERGRVYVAPPDHHLLLERGRMRVTRGPTEHRARPAIDPLFRSAAASYGPAAIGVVLSGTLDDGTAGLRAIKAAGGRTVVQEPDDALFPGMPASAVRFSDPDHVVAGSDIPELLDRLVRQESRTEADRMPQPVTGRIPPEQLSDFSCPDCRGILREERDTGLLRYRCRIGHAYSPSSLLTAQSAELERALWSGTVALEEQAELCRRLAGRMTERGHEAAASRYQEQAGEAIRQADVVRQLVLHLGHARGHQLEAGLPAEEG